MTYFVVTVDIEESFEWGVDFRRVYNENDVSNVKELLKLQSLCDKYGVKPTYLVDYPVLANETSLEILKKLKCMNCELGTHLHTWCNPPFEEEISVKNTFADNLPIKLVEKKLDNLTKKFRQTLNLTPKTFKSGRYGINEQIFDLLIKQGYNVDTSIVPFKSQASSGGSDKVHINFYPYHIKSKNKKLLEIPATVGFNFNNFNFCNSNNLLINLLKRINILKRIKLSPEDASIKDMKKICDIFINKGVPVLHLELHSSNLVIGKTSYIKNKKDLNNFYKNTEIIFDYVMNKKECIPVYCSEFKLE